MLLQKSEIPFGLYSFTEAYVNVVKLLKRVMIAISRNSQKWPSAFFKRGN